MKFDLQKSVALLTPEYFEKSYQQNNSEILVSVFESQYHNFVIPNADFSSADLENCSLLLKSDELKHKSFSCYVPEELNPQISRLITEVGAKFDGKTRYVFKHTTDKYDIDPLKIIRLNEDNFDKFVAAAEICFPGWDNEAFTKWCLNCPEVEMLAITINDNIAAFAGYFSKPDHKYVLLMNDGTMPEYRRQGLHDYDKAENK